VKRKQKRIYKEKKLKEENEQLRAENKGFGKRMKN
jgi:hypothetical protein